MSVKPIPEGYHSLTPYLIVKDAPKLIDFLIKAFGAKEIYRTNSKDGNIIHAEIKVGDSMLMMSEATETNPPSNIMFYHYVEDVDAVYKKALGAGAVSIAEVTNQFYGDRSGGVQDPTGNKWYIATHVEDLSGEEMQKREEEMKKKK